MNNLETAQNQIAKQLIETQLQLNLTDTEMVNILSTELEQYTDLIDTDKTNG